MKPSLYLLRLVKVKSLTSLTYFRRLHFSKQSFNDSITQVNYVGKAANLFDTGYQLKGSAYVISKYISNTWLWDRVRVSGGAYGGFCDFDTHSGAIDCLSESMLVFLVCNGMCYHRKPRI